VGGEEVGYRDTRRGLNELRVFLLIVVVVNVDDNDDVVVVFFCCCIVYLSVLRCSSVGRTRHQFGEGVLQTILEFSIGDN